jgi:hypothetical protein
LRESYFLSLRKCHFDGGAPAKYLNINHQDRLAYIDSIDHAGKIGKRATLDANDVPNVEKLQEPIPRLLKRFDYILSIIATEFLQHPH